MKMMNENLNRKYPIKTKAKSPKRKIPKQKKVDITTWKMFKKINYITLIVGIIAHNLCLQIIVG